jgi:hypothetical protein
VPTLDNADFPAYLADSLFRTEIATSATSVAKVRESEHMLGENGNDMVNTDLGTLTAVSALSLVYFRDRDADRFATGYNRLEKDVVVRLLDITVKKLYSFSIFQGEGKAGCHQRLAGSPFTAGNRNNQWHSSINFSNF